MSRFVQLYSYGQWVAPPVFFLGLLLLISAIASVVSLTRKAVTARLPLSERQEVVFLEGGNAVLWMEGPLLSRRFKGLSYALTQPTGEAVSGRAVLPMSSSGFSKGKRSLWMFHVPQPGAYILRVDGLGAPRPGDSKHALVFGPPIFFRLILYILGIIFSSGLVIGSLVLFLLRTFAAAPELAAGPPASKSALVVAVWIICVISAALMLATWMNRRHEDAVRRFAASQGWAVADKQAEQHLFDSLKKLLPDWILTSDVAMKVESGGRTLYLMDGTYSRVNKDSRQVAICLLETGKLGRIQAEVEIASQFGLDRLMPTGSIPLDNSAFSSEYAIYSQAATYARNLVNPDIQQILVDYCRKDRYLPIQIFVAPERMALVVSNFYNQETWCDLVKLMDGLEVAFTP